MLNTSTLFFLEGGGGGETLPCVLEAGQITEGEKIETRNGKKKKK